MEAPGLGVWKSPLQMRGWNKINNKESKKAEANSVQVAQVRQCNLHIHVI
jgi:hypothetical protein